MSLNCSCRSGSSIAINPVTNDVFRRVTVLPPLVTSRRRTIETGIFAGYSKFRVAVVLPFVRHGLSRALVPLSNKTGTSCTGLRCEHGSKNTETITEAPLETGAAIRYHRASANRLEEYLQRHEMVNAFLVHQDFLCGISTRLLRNDTKLAFFHRRQFPSFTGK
jgi:hypothetical protein